MKQLVNYLIEKPIRIAVLLFCLVILVGGLYQLYFVADVASWIKIIVTGIIAVILFAVLYHIYLSSKPRDNGSSNK
jgi:amino acid transporter